MKFLAAFIVFLFAATGCGGPARNAVVAAPTKIKADADETRGSIEIFDGEVDPAMRAVVRLKLTGMSWCSMTIVGPDIGITAGHCFLFGTRAFDMREDLPDDFAEVQFAPETPEALRGISVKRILEASMGPDYAIVRLNRSVPVDLVRPAKVVPSDAATWRNIVGGLLCAGYAADPKRGLFGKSLAISRGIRIVSEEDLPTRIDTNCFAGEGASGGPVLRRDENGEIELHGVVWGVTDVEYDSAGKLVPSGKLITSVTPAAVFRDKLEKHGVGR
jgi:hypothetical protein